MSVNPNVVVLLTALNDLPNGGITVAYPNAAAMVEEWACASGALRIEQIRKENAEMRALLGRETECEENLRLVAEAVKR